MTHVANPVNRRLGVFPTLTVRGRRSGRSITVPLGEPLTFEGSRYLVSGRGETHWVRNLRAAGEGEMRIHGRPEAFRAIEIAGPQRDRVVAAYRAKLGRSVDHYFEEIPDPSDHPVFMLEDAPATTTSIAAD
jgi:deazaflavin-dependent oxidoreductase (nitroreductase family)